MSALPTYDQALSLALSLLPREEASRDVEIIELREALGRVLAEPVHADRDLPPFNRAQMDGYALRASELAAQRSWQVITTVAAGQSVDEITVPPGACVAIATGAALPTDVDTVIQHERSDRGDHFGRDVTFTVDSIEPGHAVHRRGTDAQRGDVVIEPRTRLGPHHLGIAAMVGATTLQVLRKPRIVLLTSGDEVLPPGSDVQPHQIRNSNAPLLIAQLAQFGAAVLRHEHLPDDRKTTIEAIGRGIADADIVVTVGGVSAGDRDHFPAAFDAHDLELPVRGASIQPGRPIAIGNAPGGCLVVALPGNPVSALACCTLFIWPLIRSWLGMEATLPWREVKLVAEVKPNPARQAFRPAILRDIHSAEVPRWAGSGDLVHTAPTSGLIRLPVQRESVPARKRLPFLPWPTSCQ